MKLSVATLFPQLILLASRMRWNGQQRGAPFRLVDKAAAEQRAMNCSGGVLYSFEKVDRVTCSTVCGRFDLLIDAAVYRKELVSFGIDEDALQLAQNQISSFWILMIVSRPQKMPPLAAAMAVAQALHKSKLS